MCTAADIAAAIHERLRQVPAPDIIFLPTTGFNGSGRDLEGTHWKDLQRWFDIPIIELTATARFTF
jgi:hypothetical protein